MCTRVTKGKRVPRLIFCTIDFTFCDKTQTTKLLHAIAITFNIIFPINVIDDKRGECLIVDIIAGVSVMHVGM